MNLNDKVALSAYYSSLGFSNAKIARLLRVDASSVSRYIKQAEGEQWLEHVVRLSLPSELRLVAQTALRSVDLEEALSDAYTQRGVEVSRDGIVVVDTSQAKFEHSLALDLMGIEGGRLLIDRIEQRPKGRTILGITWGRSTGAVVSNLARMDLPEAPNLDVVPMQGGIGRSAEASESNEYFPDILAERLSLLFRSRRAPLPITLPAYIPENTAEAVGEKGLEAIGRFIGDDPSFKRASEYYDQLNLALIGIGGFEEDAWAISSGYLSDKQDVKALQEEGVCGDIACRFYADTRSGSPGAGEGEVTRRTNMRAVGISLEVLHARVQADARVIAIAGGKEGGKARALHAAVLNGLVTDFVTDEVTAQCILSIGASV